MAAAELARVGVTVNAIAPVARTRMTEGVFDVQLPEPGDNSPVVAWLASEQSGHVTGRVFEIEGGKLAPSRTAGGTGRRETPVVDGRRPSWARVVELVAEGATPEPVYGT